MSDLTIREKCALLTGQNHWESRSYPHHEIPSLFFADGPHGVRRQLGASDHLGLNKSQPATCFPTSATLANSWDEALCEEVGTALGVEAAAQGVDVLLGPGLNIKRSPTCGRNFEYFSEDPYLSGKLAAASVRGIQKYGVAACPKHFAVNSQETIRMSSDSVIDERAMREIYLAAFEMVIKEASPHCLMTSYNKINGTYANEHPVLLKQILREEWGYDGLVVTDWGGSNNQVDAIKAGAGLEMPGCGYESASQLMEALEQGKLTEEELDKVVGTLIRESQRPRNKQNFSEEEHHLLAGRAAQESIVLLKNEGNLLPLDAKLKVALIGDLARTPRYQGAGSSYVEPTHLESLLDEAKKSGMNLAGFAPGYQRLDRPDETLLKEAEELALSADIVLVSLGLTEALESEGMDRPSIDLPSNQLALIELLSKTGKPMVAVLSAGAAISSAWSSLFQGILHGYLGGQAGAGAMIRVLLGQSCPAGKLAETLPHRLEDSPTVSWYPSLQPSAEYRESIYVGYRYYEKNNIPVAFPFGFGLSYTSFSYDKLSVNETSVTFELKNIGKVAGAEISQLYIGLADSQFFRPSKELKGFAKTFLQPGETKLVSIPLDDKAFLVYNPAAHAWETEPGRYRLDIGSSSHDIRLSGSLDVEGSLSVNPYDKDSLSHYFNGSIKDADDTEFATLLGRSLTERVWPSSISANMPFCQLKTARSGIARLVFRIIDKKRAASEKEGKPDLNLLFISNVPFRTIAKMTNGLVSSEMVDGLLQAVNGRIFRGLSQVIRGFFKNKARNKAFSKQLESRKT